MSILGRLCLLVLAALLAAWPALAAPLPEAEEWNGDQIAWMSYESGLAEAAAQGKAVFLLLHTNWCPVCRTYRQRFYNSSVVDLSRKFVFVLVDRDARKDVGSRYDKHCAYIPCTMILSPDGQPDERLQPGGRAMPYYLDVRSKWGLVAFLKAAAKRYPAR